MPQKYAIKKIDPAARMAEVGRTQTKSVTRLQSTLSELRMHPTTDAQTRKPIISLYVHRPAALAGELLRNEKR